VGAAKGAGAAGATPLSAALDLVTSCSATDWPAELDKEEERDEVLREDEELDGGPGGSEATDEFQ